MISASLFLDVLTSCICTRTLLFVQEKVCFEKKRLPQIYLETSFTDWLYSKDVKLSNTAKQLLLSRQQLEIRMANNSNLKGLSKLSFVKTTTTKMEAWLILLTPSSRQGGASNRSKLWDWSWCCSPSGSSWMQVGTNLEKEAIKI